ncbi:MAG: marine proteobacterial sortase target protein [Burkholderiales bacterium]
MADVDRITGSGVLRREWRVLARFVVESFAAGLVVSAVLAIAVFIVSTPARAAAADGGTGALYLRDDAGGRTATPLLFTDVRMSVTGIAARVSVEQRFVNPSAEWREGVYVFPLPEKAAVDHLKMRIGERIVEGMIKERGEARRAYEAAKSEGRKTSLVEQERPNLFTTSVANIGPGEEVVVAIEYQETLRYDDGTFRLRFPLAITPRYIPGAPIASTSGGMGWSPATRQVEDADRITPPVADRRDGYVNPVAITIELDAGFPLARLASAYHPMRIEEAPGHRYRLTLADGPIPAARDFELAWTPDVGALPATALFTETKGGKTYALLMALPPTAAGVDAPRAAREVTYIVDTSGSMEGVSIAQARDALLLALDRLQPGDTFNVIEFNSSATALFPAPMPSDPATLGRAKQFVSGLRARGGTEMLPALELALAGPREAPGMRQVVFLTDGAVGNEDAILRFVHDAIGDRRLFTVGIGPAPNAFFMTKAAQFGRGTYTYIADVREVKEKMTALFRKLESPALTDIAVDWPAGADAWPRVVPDLYVGEPVVVVAQFNANPAGGNVMVTGRRAGATWGSLLPAAAPAGASGVGVLWARAKIDALMDAGRKGAPEEEIRTAVVDVALTHHLVSKYTSLVAVDVTPGRPAGIAASKTAMPGNIPDGLTGFDRLPRTATPAPLLIVAGGLALLLAGALALVVRGAGAAAPTLVVVAMAVAAASVAQAEPRGWPKPLPPRNLMLLPGHYDGDAGSLDAPLKDMPDAGWFVLVKDAAGSYLRKIPEAAGGRPLFLRELESATLENSATLQSALGQLYYVNLPRTALREGPVVEVPLRRRALAPVDGRAYALSLGGAPFKLTVRNGMPGRAGAHYVLDVKGATYEYLLDGFGWDSEIQYAGDIDRDGRPDLVVYVNGNSAGTWYLLLSSVAKPGMNLPAARLTASGG